MWSTGSCHLFPKDTKLVHGVTRRVHQTAAVAGCHDAAAACRQPDQSPSGRSVVKAPAPPALHHVIVQPGSHLLQGQLKQPVLAQAGETAQVPPSPEKGAAAGERERSISQGTTYPHIIRCQERKRHLWKPTTCTASLAEFGRSERESSAAAHPTGSLGESSSCPSQQDVASRRSPLKEGDHCQQLPSDRLGSVGSMPSAEPCRACGGPGSPRWRGWLLGAAPGRAVSRDLGAAAPAWPPTLVEEGEGATHLRAAWASSSLRTVLTWQVVSRAFPCRRPDRRVSGRGSGAPPTGTRAGREGAASGALPGRRRAKGGEAEGGRGAPGAA